MQKKILSDQSLEELKRTEKRQCSIFKFHIISFCILIGVAVYLTLEDDFSVYSVFPLFFFPFYIYTIINLKKVKDEIKIRTARIFLHKRANANH